VRWGDVVEAGSEDALKHARAYCLKRDAQQRPDQRVVHVVALGN
jgi:hypothetical protein